MKPVKVKKSQELLAQVNRWEGWVNMPKRDCGQEVPETAMVGLLILMASDELQGTVLEHADRLREYRQVKEKVVIVLDVPGQLKDPNAIDIGYVGEEDWTGETDPAISMWEALGGVTTAIATLQSNARPRTGRAQEKRTELSLQKG